MVKRIDCSGLSCPLPVVETRKGLKALMSGDKLEVVVDNATARENVTRIALKEGCTVEPPVAEGDTLILTITRP